MTQMRPILYGLNIDFLSLERGNIAAQFHFTAWGRLTQEA